MLLDTLKTKSLHDKRVATLERVIGATSAPLLLDKVGRFCLPDHLALPAGIRSARPLYRDRPEDLKETQSP